MDNIDNYIKLYRYMSVEEFVKMSQGIEMIPYTYEHDAHTSSKGFCFLAENTYGPEDENGERISYDPRECLVFLSYKSQEILVEFALKTKSELGSLLRRGYGKYTFDSSHDMFVTEYSLPYYDKNTLISKRYVAVFPNFLETFDLELKGLAKFFTNQLILTSTDPNQSVQFDFSSIKFKMENGEFVLGATDNSGNFLNLSDIIDNHIQTNPKDILHDLLSTVEITDLNNATRTLKNSMSKTPLKSTTPVIPYYDDDDY